MCLNHSSQPLGPLHGHSRNTAHMLAAAASEVHSSWWSCPPMWGVFSARSPCRVQAASSFIGHDLRHGCSSVTNARRSSGHTLHLHQMSHVLFSTAIYTRWLCGRYIRMPLTDSDMYRHCYCRPMELRTAYMLLVFKHSEETYKCAHTCHEISPCLIQYASWTYKAIISTKLDSVGVRKTVNRGFQLKNVEWLI